MPASRGYGHLHHCGKILRLPHLSWCTLFHSGERYKHPGPCQVDSNYPLSIYMRMSEGPNGALYW